MPDPSDEVVAALDSVRRNAQAALGLRTSDATPEKIIGGTFVRLNVRHFVAFIVDLFKLHMKASVADVPGLSEAAVGALQAGLSAFRARLTPVQYVVLCVLGDGGVSGHTLESLQSGYGKFVDEALEMGASHYVLSLGITRRYLESARDGGRNPAILKQAVTDLEQTPELRLVALTDGVYTLRDRHFEWGFK